jgi:hypothetical protein
MVALPVGQMLIRSVSNRTASATENLPEIFEVSNPKPAPPILHDDPGKPDVYYIILDGYGRADVLKNVYGFDNSEFIRQLKDRGFYIAEKGTANYPMTFMSLASSLNLNYLDDVVASTKGCTSQKLFHDVIQNPLAGRVFRSHGYRHVHFATGFRGTEDSKTADLIFSYRSRWIRGEFRDVLVSTTALRLFEPNVAGSHLYEFRKLQEVPRIPGPKFVFAHFLIPHEPYVFTSDGTVRDNVPLGLQFLEKDGTWRIGTGVDRNSYIDQLMFVNRKAIEAIDGILANSRTRPIIILQSDHGPASLRSKGREVFSRERLPNLNAYFVPDTIREKLYSSITPVNSFRIVFNDLFGTSYELLPDRNYMCWFTNIKPIDVTDIVRLGPPEPTLVAQKEKLAQVSGN